MTPIHYPSAGPALNLTGFTDVAAHEDDIGEIEFPRRSGDGTRTMSLVLEQALTGLPLEHLSF